MIGRYQVACSLDGFIAGPNGEADWIIMDPEIDFQAMFEQCDTFLIGRKSFEAMGGATRLSTPGNVEHVFSRTLRAEDYPGVSIVSEDAGDFVKKLRAGSGKDIWLWGGGELFRSLLSLGVVDTVEVGVMPVLLGDGIPLFPSPGPQTSLRLINHRVYPKSGIVGLEYSATGTAT
jgi:dihydrofolate reductase